MKLGIIFGLSAAGVAIVNSILWIINWAMMMDSARYWGDELEIITGIQAMGLYPIQSAFMLIFFIIFLRNYNKQ